jgi:hypothetical protein
MTHRILLLVFKRTFFRFSTPPTLKASIRFVLNLLTCLPTRGPHFFKSIYRKIQTKVSMTATTKIVLELQSTSHKHKQALKVTRPLRRPLNSPSSSPMTNDSSFQRPRKRRRFDPFSILE